MAWLPLTGIPDATAVALFRNGQRKIANPTRADLLGYQVQPVQKQR